MSIITQKGDSALIITVRWGMIEVISLLLKAGANNDLLNKVKCQRMCTRWFDFRASGVVLLCICGIYSL